MSAFEARWRAHQERRTAAAAEARRRQADGACAVCGGPGDQTGNGGARFCRRHDAERHAHNAATR